MTFGPLENPNQAIVVRVIGGLGNQLFNLHAGLAWAGRLGAPLIFDTSRVSLGSNPDRQLELRALDLEGWLDGVLNVRLSWDLCRAPGRLTGLRSVAIRAGRSLGIGRMHGVVGFDSDLDASVRPGKRIEAYSQTYVYAEALGVARRIDIARPTTWFNKMRERMRERPTIAMHVRLGDYRQLTLSHGIPDPGYYEAALALLLQSEPEARIWLFSDEPDAALAYVPVRLRARTEVVVSPRESPAAESMVLMSYATALAIGNSTFAWWAAWMSGERTPVVAPDPWLNVERVERLIPKTWVTLPKNGGAF